MKRSFIAVAVAGASLASTLSFGAVAAHAQDGRQRDKNNMRNLGVALGAVAAQQALKGKTGNALILGAGAALAGKKYEDARKAQSEENDRRWGRYDDRRDRDRYDEDDDRYERRRRDDEDRYDERDGDRRRPVFYHRNGERRHDNGLHRGHYKNGKRVSDKNCR
jgi:hypothetical protein